MAKAKKKESTLTLEEKLVQALVPESEQPYKVPKNWCWVRLGVLGYTNIGLTYKPSDVSEQGIIVLRSVNIQNGAMYYDDVVKVDLNISKEKMSQKGDILICARNGSKSLVGKSAIIDRDGMSYGAFMAIFRSEYNKYIYYFLNSIYFRNIIDRNVGTTTINQVTQQLIKELEFPLAPLSEQQRIVERIESLFAKLDEAKEKLQAVLDSFETRKAAIMHKAFTGELTAKWRKENGISLDSWEKKTLGEMLKVTSGKALTSKNMVSGSIPVYGGNGVTGYHNENNVEADTVVIGRVGFYCGSVHHISEKAWVTDNALIVSFNKQSINTRYLVNLLKYYDLRQNDSSTAQPVISGSKIYPIVVNIAKLKEQERIVEIIDSIFIEEKQLRNIVDDTISKIELLRKSILARAFRGEFGTNDENDECAVELLKRVL